MGLVIASKVSNQVKDFKYIITNILNITLVVIGCEINLTLGNFTVVVALL